MQALVVYNSLALTQLSTTLRVYFCSDMDGYGKTFRRTAVPVWAFDNYSNEIDTDRSTSDSEDDTWVTKITRMILTVWELIYRSEPS